ncbi:MAG: hypothetical protein ACLGH3_04620 [Actinomycetota bacterium]
MKKSILAAAVLALAIGSSVPAQSAETLWDTQVYESSSLFLSLTGGTNIGGVRFAGPGFVPTKVVVRDTLQGNVSLVAGQDFNGNNIVGEASAGEPRAVGCGTIDMTKSAVAWDVSKDISVFVQTAAVACPGQVGTSGEVDLYVDVPPLV